MSAGSGFRNHLMGDGWKEIQVGYIRVRLTEEETEALYLDCQAALHEWDEERAQTLFSIVEAEQVPESGTAP